MQQRPDEYRDKLLVALDTWGSLRPRLSHYSVRFQHPFTSYWQLLVERGRAPLDAVTLGALRTVRRTLHSHDPRFSSLEAALMAPYLAHVEDGELLVAAVRKMVPGNPEMAKRWIAFQTGYFEYLVKPESDGEDLELLPPALLECHKGFREETDILGKRKWAGHLAAPFLASISKRELSKETQPLELFLSDTPDVLVGLFDELKGQGVGPNEWEAVLQAHGPKRYHWPRLVLGYGKERLESVAGFGFSEPLVPEPTPADTSLQLWSLLYELAVHRGRLPERGRQLYDELLIMTCHESYFDFSADQEVVAKELGLSFKDS